jgi:hypothetical protein
MAFPGLAIRQDARPGPKIAPETTRNSYACVRGVRQRSAALEVDRRKAPKHRPTPDSVDLSLLTSTPKVSTAPPMNDNRQRQTPHSGLPISKFSIFNFHSSIPLTVPPHPAPAKTQHSPPSPQSNSRKFPENTHHLSTSPNRSSRGLFSIPLAASTSIPKTLAPLRPA